MPGTTDRRGWKLRYAAHLGLAAPDAPLFRASARSAAVEDQVAWLADKGFAGVQDNFLKLRTPDEQRRLAHALERHGLAMGSFNNNPTSWDRPLWSATDAGSRAELERELETSLTLATLTGARSAVCVTGRDATRTTSAQLAAMADNLRRLADRAARAGFALCVESVAAERFPQLLVNGIDEALQVVRAADHPAVRLQFDVAHVEMNDGDAFGHLRRCWSDVELVQVADVPGRVDLGAGKLDWVAILRWIRARGYAGLIEIEHEPAAAGIDGERALLERLRAIDDAL